MAGKRLEEDFQPQERALTRWIMAALSAGAAGWVGWMLGWPWIVDLDHPDFNPMILLLAILIGTLVWQIVQALRWTARARRFGASVLEVDSPLPARLGGPFAGRVRTIRPVASPREFRVVLTCHDIHESNQNRNGTPRKEAFPVWSKEAVLPAKTSTVAGLAFAFQLPSSVGPEPQPAIRPRGGAYFSASASINIPGFRKIVAHNSPPVARTWTLSVTNGPGSAEFRAEFDVPVTKG